MNNSCIFYKFHNEKDDALRKFAFEGNVISVEKIKNHILKQFGIQNVFNVDFIITICNANDLSKQYEDNDYIQKNESLIIRRSPAHNYFLNKRLIQRNRHNEQNTNNNNTEGADHLPLINIQPLSEDDKIKEVMNSALPPLKVQPMISKRLPGDVPPHGYICYTCKQPGHYRNFCPENKFLRASGIPKNFLQPVSIDEIDNLDNNQALKKMVIKTKDGLFVPKPTFIPFIKSQ